MMRVLVTGASGHVGGAIANHLVEVGWEVVGIGRHPLNTAGAFPFIQIDLGAPDAVTQLMESVQGCSAIVHTAASLDKRLYAHEVVTTNCLGTQQILEVASHWRVSEFVFISSIGVVGLPQQVPVTEEHPVAPRTTYHASKVFGEHLVTVANQAGETNGAILRLPSPVGPGMPDNRIVSVFVHRALKDDALMILGQGTRRQNYVDVRDVASAVVSCIRRRAVGVYNVAANTTISNRDLAYLCKSVLDSSSPIVFSEKPDPEESISWDISIAKATRELDYQPRYTIKDAIAALAR